MTIKELSIQKIKLRNSDSVRANAYGSLLDVAQKIAKVDNRNVTDNDILSAARKLVKDLSSTIDLVKEGPVIEQYKQEVEIFKEFLPKVLTKEETLSIVKMIVSENSTLQLRDITPLLKEKGLDMKIAFEEAKRLLFIQGVAYEVG